MLQLSVRAGRHHEDHLKFSALTLQMKKTKPAGATATQQLSQSQAKAELKATP